jgi:hypothetical protein
VLRPILICRLICLSIIVAGFLLAACGDHERDNPSDPGIIDDDLGLELIATVPVDLVVPSGSRLLSDVRFSITAADMRTPVTGTMNLVGERARAVARGIPDGTGRRIHVEAFDGNRIRTFSATDTIDILGGVPSVLFLPLIRLTGGVELTSVLPPEIVSMSVAVVIGGDTTSIDYDIDEANLQKLITDIPTGTGVRLLLRGRDSDDQVLVSEDVLADVRDDLLARVSLPVVTGAVSITASFPDYLPMVTIDRFSDSAVFYRRSDNPKLPDPGEPIDFDRLFLHRGLGPNQESIEFYNFDARSKTPAKVYVIVDRRGDRIEQQLPIFDEIPGGAGYNDLRRVIEVQIADAGFQPNSLTSLADIQAAGAETTATEQIMNCVIVPDGSSANLRFDPTDAVGLHDGWYRDQIVRYLLFENPASRATVEFGGQEISAPVMYAFFENDRDPSSGFATDDLESTHNVVTRLPEQEGYSPLWALRVFKLSVFDRVSSVGSAQDSDREDNVLTLPEVLIINAPVVSTGVAQGG